MAGRSETPQGTKQEVVKIKMMKMSASYACWLTHRRNAGIAWV